MRKSNLIRRRREAGETLMGMIVALGLGASVLAAATSSFLFITQRSEDHRTIAMAQEKARSTLSIISYDLRMIGSGMPLGQPQFTINEAALGDAPLPILVTENGAVASSATKITYRLNEKARSAYLTTDYIQPSAMNSSFVVHSASDLAVGDTLYISDMTVGGVSGLMGKIGAIAGSSPATINLSGAPKASAFLAGTTIVDGVVAPNRLRSGSLVQRVTKVVLTSPTSNEILLATPNLSKAIERDPGTGSVKLAPNSRFTLEYLRGDGTTITLPLTAAAVANELSAIRVTVTVPGLRKLRSGASYTATATETVGIRNMTINR